MELLYQILFDETTLASPQCDLRQMLNMSEMGLRRLKGTKEE